MYLRAVTGLDLTRSSAIRYTETRSAAVLEAKLGLLEEVRQHHAILQSPHHVVTAADTLDFDAVRSAAASLDRTQTLTVLCEGLIMRRSRACEAFCGCGS
jgi:hypothetical protein